MNTSSSNYSPSSEQKMSSMSSPGDSTSPFKKKGPICCPMCLQSFSEKEIDNHVRKCCSKKSKKHEKSKSSSSSSTPDLNSATSQESPFSSKKETQHVSSSPSKGISHSFPSSSKWEPLPKIKSCPVFYPSESEFKDPMKYIASISEKAKKSGIVKIVPPSDKWLQGKPFTKIISNKNFIFPTKLQSLHQLQNRAGPCSKFMEELENFLEKRGTPIKGLPIIDGQELDLYSLYNAVMSRGGLQQVIAKKDWKNIAKELRLSPECTSAAFTLKQNYYKYLYSFELNKKNKSESQENMMDWSLSPQKDDSDIEDQEGNKLEEFGYGDGRLFTLSSFKKMARQFKRKWFGDDENASPSDIENTYWRIVENAEEAVQVHYGSDLDVGTYGSGFPGRENPSELKKCSGWNLNKFPKLQDSLLSYIEEDIKGVIQPMMYIGMLFSTFCWHTEDNYLYSINYLHHGASKTWYGIPDCAASEFEHVMRKTVPELFNAHPDLLYLLITMLSPRNIAKNKVQIFHTIQEAGEFIITFPNAYHAGFSHGFNCAESTNFALADWLPYGRESIQIYKQFNRSSVFSFEQLIIKMAEQCHSTEHAIHLKRELPLLKSSETHLRQKVFNEGIWKTVYFQNYCGDRIPECAVCKYDCFESAVACPCSSNRVVCLEHSHNLCTCDNDKKFLLFRHKLSDFDALMQKIGMDLNMYRREPPSPFYTSLPLPPLYRNSSFGSARRGKKKLGRTFSIIKSVTKPAVQKLARRGGVYPIQTIQYRENNIGNPVDEMFTIEDIIDRRINNHQPEYLLKWLGYPSSESTWEREDNLVCPILLNQYKDKHGIKRPAPSPAESTRPRRRPRRMTTT